MRHICFLVIILSLVEPVIGGHGGEGGGWVTAASLLMRIPFAAIGNRASRLWSQEERQVELGVSTFEAADGEPIVVPLTLREVVDAEDYSIDSLTEKLRVILGKVAEMDKLSTEDYEALDRFALAVMEHPMTLEDWSGAVQADLLKSVQISGLADIRKAMSEDYRQTGSCKVREAHVQVFDRLERFFSHVFGTNRYLSMLNNELPERLCKLEFPINSEQLTKALGINFPWVTNLHPFQYLMWLFLGLEPDQVLDKQGNTVLHLLAKSSDSVYDELDPHSAQKKERQITIIGLCRWAGANLFQENAEGKLPVQVARFYNRQAAIEALAHGDNPFDTDSTDLYSIDDLRGAIMNDRPDELRAIIRHLIVDESGMLVDWRTCRDEQGNTLLHWAAFYGEGLNSVYHVLLPYIDPRLTNNFGWVALDLSTHYRGTYIGQTRYDILKEAGLDEKAKAVVGYEAALEIEYALTQGVDEETGVFAEGGHEIDFQQGLCRVRRALLSGQAGYTNKSEMRVPLDEDSLTRQLQKVTRFFQAFRGSVFEHDVLNYVGNAFGKERKGLLSYYIESISKLDPGELGEICERGNDHPALKFFECLLLLGVQANGVLDYRPLTTCSALPNLWGGDHCIGQSLVNLLIQYGASVDRSDAAVSLCNRPHYMFKAIASWP